MSGAEYFGKLTEIKNGSQFTSSEFQQFMGLIGVKHIKTTSYHPSSNEIAERFVQVLKSCLFVVSICISLFDTGKFTICSV
jgi:hypothetical protein